MRSEPALHAGHARAQDLVPGATPRERYTLISHQLCPSVQRAAIVLAERGIAFERVDVDLSNKPDWFLRISPWGKTPVLLVDGEPIFESAVICEYLEDTAWPRLHPAHALQHARHRAWMAFGSAVLNTIAGFYNAPDATALHAKAAALRSHFEQVEGAMGNGPCFAGADFSVVDAVFGPVFRNFDAIDGIADFGFFQATPRVTAWRTALAARSTVRDAADPAYPQLLRRFLQDRDSALSGLTKACPHLLGSTRTRFEAPTSLAQAQRPGPCQGGLTSGGERSSLARMKPARPARSVKDSVQALAPDGPGRVRSRSARALERGDTKRALVWCGTELLTERGFQVTGIDEVLRRVGVPKGSFYHFFANKHAFGEAVIQNYVEFYARKMSRIFDDATLSPLSRLRLFVDDAKRGMSKYGYRRGCLVGNLGQELASLDDGFREQLEAVLVSWEQRVAACLELAIQASEVPATTDAAAVSRFFWIGWEGAVLRAKLTRDAQPLDQFAELFFSMLEPPGRAGKRR